MIAMRFLLSTILMCINVYKSEQSGDIDINLSIQNDLKRLNASCTAFDSCAVVRSNDSLDNYSCQCGAICAQLGTCCIDSPYSVVTSPKVKPKCRSLDEDRAFFMVDYCPFDGNENGIWEKLCQEEWNTDDHVMKTVPVTSIFTHITYRNFFCLRCHEATNEYLFWNIKLSSFDYDFNQTINDNELLVSLEYDPGNKTWMARLGTCEDPECLIQVDFKIEIPQEILPLPVTCDPDVISNCSDQWTDQDTVDKCDAYTGIVHIEKNETIFKYRNVHCALCNDFEVHNRLCKPRASVLHRNYVPFSFTHLLDINQSGGNKVGRTKRCEEGYLWDPFSMKCKQISCALPGYVIIDGKCVPP